MPRGPIPARLRPAAWALADQCVVSAANFLTVYLFARYMAAAAFGEFAIAQTALLLLTSMQGALLAQPHNVLGAGREETSYRHFTASLLIAQAVGAVLLCSLLAAAGWLLALGPAPRGGIVVVAQMSRPIAVQVCSVYRACRMEMGGARIGRTRQGRIAKAEPEQHEDQ